jgi:hypothetical protein
VLIYWDDWKNPMESYSGEWGEHLAWREWIEKHGDVEAETLEVNWVDQRTMLLTAVGGKRLSLAKVREIRRLNDALDPSWRRVLRFVVDLPGARALMRGVLASVGRLQKR